MKDLTSSQIRQLYLDFFKEKGHQVVPSASLIPVKDASLLWVNSGVATMKKYFDGTIIPTNPRMVSVQDSIRTNDIENVGKTPVHQTLFEMLGNFSIGDYFKKDAIAWAYELLTGKKWFAWDKNKLYVTVYPEDKESKKLWQEVGVKPDHIIEVKDNFWDIGLGPSGPDTEIFYDRGQDYSDLPEGDPELYPGGENQRYVEVWNIVFSQFNHTKDGEYKPLPSKNIDTGMGLERVASIFQSAKTNFDTDLFMPLIHTIEKLSDNKTYGKNKNDDVAFKIIADHIRTVSFAIADGALPSNEGRGYVIRRLLRRASVQARKLGIRSSSLYKLVVVVGKMMQQFYPNILKNSQEISRIIKQEEERFNKTLSNGLKLLNKSLNKASKSDNKTLSGATAFKLYDTYGFPLEMTEEYAHEDGIKVDKSAFDKEMKEQQTRAHNSQMHKSTMNSQNRVLLDLHDASTYVGYDKLAVSHSRLLDLIKSDHLVKEIGKNEIVQAIFSLNPFYAEMGGQVGDIGWVKDENGKKVAKVTNTTRAPHGQHLLHLETQLPMKVGHEYQLEVNKSIHQNTEKNHTATHLLDQALRNVVGNNVHQAGSLVTPNYLRFDFTHDRALSKEDLNKVEQMVNEQIFKALPVKTILTSKEKGKQMGAIALFDEKYQDQVRVVKIGDFSVEFCGGNHVANTNELGLFKIIKESGIGSGTRRIEAVTSKAAFKFLNDKYDVLNNISKLMGEHEDNQLLESIKNNQHEINNLRTKLQVQNNKNTLQQAKSIFDKKELYNDKSLISGIVKNSNMKNLRELADNWRNENLSDILILAAPDADKISLLVAVSNNQVKNGLKANDIFKVIAPFIKAKGGGRPNLVQAGGTNSKGFSKGLEQVKQFLLS